MNALTGPLPGNTAGGARAGRQLAVSKCLRWNTGREAHKIKWGEVESRLMGYENLQRRRQLIADTIACKS